MTDAAPTQTTDGWQDILESGETILWQGRPDPAIVFTLANVGTLIFGLFFAGFALFWMIMAASGPSGFWMFGLLHFGIGLSMAFGSLFWGPWRRRHTWYTLTNKHAFIATDIPFKGRRLKSYPITAESHLDLTRGALCTVNFTHEMKRTKNGTKRVDIGFERISDGAEVFKMMRDIQQNDSTTKGRKND